MKVHIEHQETYSRGQLLARTFFGVFYIVAPHFLALMLYSIYAMVLWFYAIFYGLVTAKLSRSAYEAIVGVYNWQVRIEASLFNLVDGYPPFGPTAKWSKAYFEIGYPEKLSRLRIIYVLTIAELMVIPQIIVLFVYLIGTFFVAIYAWFVVLFTTKYPAGAHKYMVNVIRMTYRINFYLIFLYFVYPSFNGEENEADKLHS